METFQRLKAYQKFQIEKRSLRGILNKVLLRKQKEFYMSAKTI